MKHQGVMHVAREPAGDKIETASLADKMDALAEGHPRADELREKAAALRAGCEGFFAAEQTINVMQFVGRWARARRLWCEITGEPLV